MTRVGLIHNPRSRRNRRAPTARRRQEAEALGFLFAAPESPPALAESLAGFARHGVGLVVVDGGDGTVREVVTALPEAFGAALPQLAVLPSGKTNLLAASLGTRLKPGAALRRLDSQGRAAARVRDLAALEVSWNDGSRDPVRGFFLGAAGFTRAVAMAEAAVHSRGVTQGPAVALTIIAAAAQMCLGRSTRWHEGEAMALGFDDRSIRAGHRLLFLATTLDRLMLGLWPFWGGGSGPIRYLEVDAHPRRLGASLWRIMRGAPAPWMADEYRSGRAEEIAVQLAHPFILDGERFDPGPGGMVRVRTGPHFRFVVP